MTAKQKAQKTRKQLARSFNMTLASYQKIQSDYRCNRQSPGEWLADVTIDASFLYHAITNARRYRK